MIISSKCSTLFFISAVVLILINQSQETTATYNGGDAEVDALAARFSTSLKAASQHMGINDGEGTFPVNQLEDQMRQFYLNIEKHLVDARQRAALARSSLVTNQIDVLRLV